MARTQGRRGNTEASIFKRASDGRWVGAVHLGYLPNGKRRRKYIYAATRAEVAARVAELSRLVAAGLPIPDDKLMTGAYLRTWLASARPTVRPRTFEWMAGHVDRLADAFEKVPLSRLSPAEIRTYLASTLASGLSPRTTGLRLGVLRQAIGQAVRDGIVSRNVALLVERPRAVRPEIRPLTPEQARTFLGAIRGDRLEALYTVGLALGLRQGEILGLRWSDVDLAAGTLSVRVALSILPKANRPNGGRRGTRYALVEPKTARSRRTLVMPTLVVAALHEHRRRQLEERLAAGSRWRGTWDLVFTTPNGSPLDSRYVTRAFQAILSANDLPRLRFHDLRHSCATLLLVMGVNPRVVMETLGHSTISMTLGTYSHVLPALARDAADRMGEVLAAR